MPRATCHDASGIFTPEHLANPYPLYQRMRDVHPVCWDDSAGTGGAWMVTGFDAAHDVLRDPRLSAQRVDGTTSAGPQADGTSATIMRMMYRGLFSLDPPAHARVRRGLAHPFTPQAVAALRRRIKKTAHALLDQALGSGAGEMDVMASYAFALPATIMAGLFGIPADDWHQYFGGVLSWGLLVDNGPAVAANQDRLVRGVARYRDYFRDQLSRPPAPGARGLLRLMEQQYNEGAIADEDELMGNLILFLNAGMVTTAHQIGNTLLHLLGDPGLLGRLRADPGMLAATTAEFLRHDCSVQLTKRRVVEPVEVCGQAMDSGDEIFVWLGAANRDPARFPDPDRLDLGRSAGRHLAFSHGLHYCLGAQLGQLTHQTGVRIFLERVPNPQVNPDGIMRSGTATFHGPHVLPVHFG